MVSSDTFHWDEHSKCVGISHTELGIRREITNEAYIDRSVDYTEACSVFFFHTWKITKYLDNSNKYAASARGKLRGSNFEKIRSNRLRCENEWEKTPTSMQRTVSEKPDKSAFLKKPGLTFIEYIENPSTDF